nr:DUF359 domain-containing protein [Candidatus Sigynarchaeota archaeon]
MEKDFDAMAIPKEKVLKVQVLALIVAGYAAFDMISVVVLGEYLYYDGIPVLISLYIVPLVCLLVVFAIFFKKTFKRSPFRVPKRSKHAPAVPETDRLTALFFPPGIDILAATKELRPELAKLHGDLIAGTEAETLPLVNKYLHKINPPFLAGCGDVISKNLVKTDFFPDIVVIDGKTCRQGYGTVFPESYERRQVPNVTGAVSRAAWDGIKAAVGARKRIIIEVTGGEEDLLLIPLVLFAPDNAIVAYGQPPVTDVTPPIRAGAVMVKVTPDVKDHFAAIFAKFVPSA